MFFRSLAAHKAEPPSERSAYTLRIGPDEEMATPPHRGPVPTHAATRRSARSRHPALLPIPILLPLTPATFRRHSRTGDHTVNGRRRLNVQPAVGRLVPQLFLRRNATSPRHDCLPGHP